MIKPRWSTADLRSRLLLFSVLILGLITAAACTAPANQAQPASQADAASSGNTPEELVPTRTASDEQTLTVFAPASLTEAFSELGRLFEAQNPGAKVTFNFAGSQQLAQQLAQGAPADVFASADQVQMEAAVKAGRVAGGEARPLIGNKLAPVYAGANPSKLTQLKDLARPGLKLILADSKVPAGRYSLEFLEKASQNPDFGASFKEDVLKNVVSYEESVRAVLTKVWLGEADAGIVYASDIITKSARQVGALEIPDALNINALYFISKVQDSPRAELAQRFIELSLSQEGQELLARYGFLMVQ
jgi:molybdate transport system substrate-binding protein